MLSGFENNDAFKTIVLFPHESKKYNRLLLDRRNQH